MHPYILVIRSGQYKNEKAGLITKADHT